MKVIQVSAVFAIAKQKTEIAWQILFSALLQKRGAYWGILILCDRVRAAKKLHFGNRLLTSIGRNRLSMNIFRALSITIYYCSAEGIGALYNKIQNFYKRDRRVEAKSKEKKSGTCYAFYDALLYCMALFTTTKGNSTVKSVPWFIPLLVAHTRPSWSSTNCFTMDSPKPVEDSPPVG